MFHLTRHDACPLGEFFIIIRFKDGVETITHTDGSKTDGFVKFGPWPSITITADELGLFRRANRLPGWDRGTCIKDIDLYTCQRLGNSPRWCMDSDAPYTQVTASPAKVNSGGGCCGRGRVK
jgi:hypothetical protein